MLKSIALTNFKSYASARLPLAPLTTFVGMNAAGKSNAIEALRLLSFLASGGKLPYLYTNKERNAIRGRPSDLFYNQADSFTIECVMDDAPSGYDTLTMTIVCRDDELHIKHENISNGNNFLYRIICPLSGNSGDIMVSYAKFDKGRAPVIQCNDQSAIFSQLTSPASFNGYEKAAKTIPNVTHAFEKQLSSFLFLDPMPAKMRGYSFPADKYLETDGANISGILYRLTEMGDKDTCGKQRDVVLSFVKSLPEQNITGLKFVEVKDRGDKMLVLTETFGDTERRYDATLLSDGTLRVLAIAAAMLTAESGSLVVIEEIDNGVHPSRAKRLIENIIKVAEQRKIQVLLSTHNPALLDALPYSAIPDIACCYRDPVEGASKIIRLDDMDDYPLLVAQGGLGYLSTSGILERFIKNRPTQEERKERALAWLESMQEEDEAE